MYQIIGMLAIGLASVAFKACTARVLNKNVQETVNRSTAEVAEELVIAGVNKGLDKVLGPQSQTKEETGDDWRTKPTSCFPCRDADEVHQ